MFEALLERLGNLLDRYHIPYMIIGGQAVLLYGEPRFSKDVDLTLGLEPTQVGTLLEALKSAHIQPLVEDPQGFVQTTCVLPCQDPETGFRLDFVFSFSDYERQALQRVRRTLVGKTPVAFASVEDLIIHKMVAGRPRDLEDVKGILIKNPTLDSRYLHRWLEDFEKGLAQPILHRFKEIQESLRS